MKLQNRDGAYIPRDKIIAYLLSPTHPVGRLKAHFFRSIGFDTSDITELEGQFLRIAHNEDVIAQIISPYGIKFIVDGVLERKGEAVAQIRTIWIIDAGGNYPRFVTAYPL